MSEREAFLLERYKYILDRKKFLNEATLRVAGFYQSCVVLIAAGEFSLVAARGADALTGELAALGTLVLWALLTFVSLFSLIALVGGVFSWIDYRREEGDVEAEFLGGRRPLPSFQHVWRWYEIHVSSAIIMMFAVLTYLTFSTLLPQVS